MKTQKELDNKSSFEIILGFIMGGTAGILINYIIYLDKNIAIFAVGLWCVMVVFICILFYVNLKTSHHDNKIEYKNRVIVDEKSLANYVIGVVQASQIEQYRKQELLIHIKDFHIINTMSKLDPEKTLNACLGLFESYGIFEDTDEFYKFNDRIEKKLKELED